MSKRENVSHWSYSSAKKIYRKGIDYAVGVKLGVIPESIGKSADIGRFVHAVLLGGDQEFVVSPYRDYRSKEAREWRDAQTLTILNEAEFETITTIAERIKSHPLASKLLIGENVENEVELRKKINGVEWLGYADAIGYEGEKIAYIADLKTTAQFDDFKWQASRQDYDLQASVYHLLTKTAEKPFYWVIAETVAPYRVGVALASQEFEERGYSKLQTVCEDIERFNARAGGSDLEKLNFNQNESMDDLLLIGDWSV